MHTCLHAHTHTHTHTIVQISALKHQTDFATSQHNKSYIGTDIYDIMDNNRYSNTTQTVLD